MIRPTPDWLTPCRHVTIGAPVRLQNPGDRVWHGLRREYYGGDPPQASPDGLLRNDLDGAMGQPSPIDQRVMAAAARILATPDPAFRQFASPRPQLLTSDMRLTGQERADMLVVFVQLFIRDISQDLIFPPPARVASVMLTEIDLYRRAAQRPEVWPRGPLVSVETVVRADATEWLFGKLDAAVARALERLTLF